MNTTPSTKPISLIDRKRNLTPHEFALSVRAGGDFYYWEPGNFFVVTRYGLATQLLKNPALSADRQAFFISRMPKMDLSLIGDFFSVVKPMMVMSDKSDHMLRRGVAARSFDADLIQSFDMKIIEEVKRLVEPLVGLRGFDFFTKIASQLPMRMLASLFDIPEEERSAFFRCSELMTGFFGGASSYLDADGIQVNEAAFKLKGYMTKLITERRARPGVDFVSTMLSQNERFKLSDEELISQCVMMLVAGQVTTTDQICNNLYTALSTPDIWETLVQEPELIPTALEEFNRWDPGVTFLFRETRADLEVCGIKVKAGSVLFFANHAINRDEAVIANPHQVNIRRTFPGHFAYGNGSH